MRALNTGKGRFDKDGRFRPSRKDLKDLIRIITDASLDPDLIIILPNGTKLPIKTIVEPIIPQKGKNKS